MIRSILWLKSHGPIEVINKRRAHDLRERTRPEYRIKRCIYYYCKQIIMSTEVYSIRVSDSTRQAMEEMSDINWQAEIRQAVEKMVREKKKLRALARMQERWKDQIPNKIGAAAMIREDRDA